MFGNIFDNQRIKQVADDWECSNMFPRFPGAALEIASTFLDVTTSEFGLFWGWRRPLGI